MAARLVLFPAGRCPSPPLLENASRGRSPTALPGQRAGSLALAIQGFFARVKRGQAPGFPRFRSAERFVGWGYKEHDNGFRVALRADGKHGHANLFGIPLRQSPGRDGRAEVCRLAA
jgi:hypothetical protein